VSAWLLKRGEDFDGKPEGFRTQVFNAAKQRGVRVRTQVNPDGDAEGLAIQAIGPRKGSAAPDAL
jgi:hypothetical protein